jgi:hypothetical protein
MSAFHYWQRVVKAFRGSADPRLKKWRTPLPLRLEGLEDRTVPSNIFVAPGGQDVVGGGGPGNPFGSIQYAVNTAASGDTIRVAAGTYLYNAAADQLQSLFGTQVIIAIAGKQLTILGGFSTNNFNTANPTANPTIIDGQGTRRAVMLLANASSPATTIDFEGFTVQNCVGGGIAARGGEGGTFAFGGGIFLDLAGQQALNLTSVLRNDVFINNAAIGTNTGVNGGNAAGGGVEINGGNATLDTLTFTGNHAVGGTGTDRGGFAVGGGLVVANGANATGNNLTFNNNIVTAGNGSGSGVEVGPSAGQRADALGGAAAVQINATLTLTNVIANGNSITGGGASGIGGGGAYGGAFFAEKSNLSITDATINNNTATGGTAASGGTVGGGGIELVDSNLTLNRVTIQGNTAAGGASNNGGNAGPVGGGGLYLTRFSGNSSFSITNAVITDNMAKFAGAGNTSVGGGGGGIWLQGVNGTITQSTIANNNIANTLIYGQGIIMISDGTQPSGTTLNLSYSVIANHTNTTGAAALDVRRASTQGQPNIVNLNTNLFAGNSVDDNTGPAPDAPPGVFNGTSTTVKAASAGFVNAGALNYGLIGSSAARNLGVGSTVTVDRNQNPRNSPTDLGAFQFVPPTIQFGQASYDFPEAAGPVTITLSLNQPTDTAVSFLVTASDGTAKAGVNYQPFSGMVTIPAGQVSGNFSVSLLDDGVKTGFLRINLGLSGVSGNVVLGAQSKAVLTIKDNEPSDNQAFVSGLFHDTLNRAVDPVGLPFYTNLLDGLMVPILPSVMTFFVNAPEYQGLLVNAPGTGFFSRYLGRIASQAETTFWSSQLTAGVTDETVIAGFVGSNEYFQNPNKGNNSNATFVNSAFQDILGRKPDTGGLNFYVGLLNSGSATREQVATALLTSTEYRINLVNADFKGYLNRPVATPDISYWVGQIQQGVPDEQLIVRIGGSLEGYQNNGNGHKQWITRLYNKVLGRDPEASGLQFYLNILTGGYQNQRILTAQSIASSTEARTNRIKDSYTKYLGRPASPGDVNSWLAQFLTGMSNQQFVANLVGSGEYFANPKKGNASNLTWLQSAFQDILGHALDANSQSTFLAQLNSGVPLTTVALTIATSQDAYTQNTQSLFNTYLHRTAAPVDLAFWVAQFTAGVSTEFILGGIIGSQEYYFNAHTFP